MVSHDLVVGESWAAYERRVEKVINECGAWACIFAPTVHASDRACSTSSENLHTSVNQKLISITPVLFGSYLFHGIWCWGHGLVILNDLVQHKSCEAL